MSDDLFDLLNNMHEESDSGRQEILWAPFGYPGGKSRSIDKIMPHLPYRDKWVDVFCGSGVVTLNRRLSKVETMNDRYSGITQFYRCLANRELKDKLIDRLDTTVMSREEFLFCKKNWEEHTVDVVERAARWFYMVQASFGSLGRNFGRQTGKTCSASKIRNGLENFEPIHQRLRNVQIENQDFKQIIKDFASDDCVFYCDPPYLNTDQSGYNKMRFTESDHKDLLKLVFEQPGFFAVSSYANDLYAKYPWDDVVQWEVAISMLGMAFTEENFQIDAKETRSRDKATEVLYIKKGG